MSVKKLAKISSILVVALLLSVTFSTKVFSQNSISINTSSTAQGLKFVGSNTPTGTTKVNISIAPKDNPHGVITHKDVAVTSGGFTDTFSGLTQGKYYDYWMIDSVTKNLLTRGEAFFYVPATQPVSSASIAASSWSGGIVFVGQNITGSSVVKITLYKNGVSAVVVTENVTNNGFTKNITTGLTANTTYIYAVTDNVTGTIIKNGTGTIVYSGTATSTPTSGSGGGGSSSPSNPSSSGGGGSSAPSDPSSSAGGGTSTPSSPSQQILIENPLKGIDSIPKLIEVILNYVLTIGTWILVGFIIYSGYKFVAAQGNDKELIEAKQALKYTLIGGAILLGSWVIAEALVGTIEALK